MNKPPGNWLSKLIKQAPQAKPDVAGGQSSPPAAQPPSAYQKGDFIGQHYEVYGELGKGGFGVVYLVYSHQTRQVYALKTFRDVYLADTQIRQRFRKEAGIWVELGAHPYLVRSHFVDEKSGRIYIAMEYIAPNERGLNSLEGYLERQPPDRRAMGPGALEQADPEWRNIPTQGLAGGARRSRACDRPNVIITRAQRIGTLYPF